MRIDEWHASYLRYPCMRAHLSGPAFDAVRSVRYGCMPRSNTQFQHFASLFSQFTKLSLGQLLSVPRGFREHERRFA